MKATINMIVSTKVLSFVDRLGHGVQKFGQKQEKAELFHIHTASLCCGEDRLTERGSVASGSVQEAENLITALRFLQIRFYDK